MFASKIPAMSLLLSLSDGRPPYSRLNACSVSSEGHCCYSAHDHTLRAPAGMSLMTQVAGVLKTTAKDFNVAALVRMTRLAAA